MQKTDESRQPPQSDAQRFDDILLEAGTALPRVNPQAACATDKPPFIELQHLAGVVIADY